MAHRSEHPVEVAVAGGGIIGLSVAWAAAQRGLTVAVLEREHIGAGASSVAAGMLAPVSEVEYGAAGRRLLELGLRSAGMWPRFAQGLADATGIDVGLRRCGTMLLARDADDARELERQLDLRRSLGLPVERLRGSEARDREPALAPCVRLALDVPDDHAVDPRAVMRALRLACSESGVQLREGTEVAGVELDAGGERVEGLALGDGTRLAAERVVLALGAWTPRLTGLPAHAAVPVRPVKGQIVRLRDPAGAGLLDTVLRHTRGYIVPRGDGRYVLGATVEERGYELTATAGGVYELLRDAYELVPGIAELEIEELSVGLRPGTPDNAPVLGAGSIGGLLWASGHHRNGVLLAPLTAELLANELAPGDGGVAGERGRIALPRAELLAACSPSRFAPSEPRPSEARAGAELVS
ncbi:MAG TPA: glycine oxidase ThiO [Solirubrobacteraceae bacterium]|nr:glycine oxidase ThiO [Solirubrobacteraceae bacterium]